MKKTIPFLSIAILIIAGNVLKAQNLIAVQNGSNATFYANLDSAITNAPSGSTIYIPGGIFNLNTPINKKLNIIGTGHNQDSSAATNSTYLNGITLITGANGGLITGIYFNGALNIGTTTTDEIISNYQISRCNLYSIVFHGSHATNIIFSENIINNGVNMGNSTNNLFSNNFSNVSNYFSNIGVNNSFVNNIFLAAFYYDDYNSRSVLTSCQYSLINNNIFIGHSGVFTVFYGISNSTANNNLFVENISFPIAPYSSPYFPAFGNDNGSNNIANQNSNSIFINLSGNSFSYTDNYHLQATCPGKNAGTDGTDIGIYGGKYPWKDGSVPFNPHIIINNIGNTTNTNGLPVNIKVEAQDH